MQFRINNFLFILFSLFFLLLSQSAVAQLNAEIIGDAEITGDLKIKYNNPDQSNTNMLILERFQGSINLGQITIPASRNNWSFDLDYGFLNGGNNLNLKYNGETKLTFNRAIGEINRPQTGSADLLPYAYGRIENNSNTVLGGTQVNYTIDRSSTFYTTITFAEPIADLLIFNVTPIVFTSFEFPEINTQVGVEYVDTSSVRIYLYNAFGNRVENAPFSFVAYKP